MKKGPPVWLFLMLLFVALMIESCNPLWQFVNNGRKGYYKPPMQELHVVRKEAKSICPMTERLQDFIDCHTKSKAYRKDL